MKGNRMRARAGRLTVVMILVATVVPGAPSMAGRPGNTELVSVASDGSQQSRPVDRTPIRGNEFTAHPHNSSLSADGRLVAFVSSADDLVAGDTNLATDVFVHDRTTGRTERVSVSTSGAQGVGVAPLYPQWGSYDPAMSGNGRYVAFRSWATNLVAGDTNAHSDVFVHDLETRTTERVSVTTGGKQSSELPCTTAQDTYLFGWEIAISRSGHRVAFASNACDLVSEGTEPGNTNIFVHDRTDVTTEIVSVTSDGSSIPGDNWDAAISASGRFVSFWGFPDGIGTFEHAYVRDLVKKKTEIVSVASDGTRGSWIGVNYHPLAAWPAGHFVELSPQSLSSNGRYVAFKSYYPNLIPNDRNGISSVSGTPDIFVHDRLTGRTERVSVSSSGTEASSDSAFPVISGNGRYVAFSTWATNIIGEGGSAADGPLESPWLVVYDRKTGAVERVAVSIHGGPPESNSCDLVDGDDYAGIDDFYRPSISNDGRFVSFDSCFEDLVDGDANDGRDVFVRDRGLEVGALSAHERDGDRDGPVEGGDVICLEGLCIPPLGVVATLDADDGPDPMLAARQGADLYGASLAYRPQYEDLFVRLRLEDMPDLFGTGRGWGTGSPAILYAFRFEADGVSYEVRVQRSARGLLATSRPTFGLFRCRATGPCDEIAALEGGYGTTGEEVVFSIPLDVVGLSHGGRLRGLEGLTALGAYETGAIRQLDSVKLPGLL